MSKTSAVAALALATAFAAGNADAQGYRNHYNNHHNNRDRDAALVLGAVIIGGAILQQQAQQQGYYAPPVQPYYQPHPRYRAPVVLACTNTFNQDYYGRPRFAGSLHQRLDGDTGVVLSERYSNRPCPRIRPY